MVINANSYLILIDFDKKNVAPLITHQEKEKHIQTMVTKGELGQILNRFLLALKNREGYTIITMAYISAGLRFSGPAMRSTNNPDTMDFETLLLAKSW